MSLFYKAVGWNDFKKRYDCFLLCGIVLFLAAFAAGGWIANPDITIEILLMRGFAVAAFFLLHIIMAIGPLARMNARWLPLLYNRRHMGVSVFLLAALHSVFAVLIYHTGGEMNPVHSILTTDAGWRMTAAPFQAFGLAALAILFVMAATSHDFWLANLTPPVWKTLHMGGLHCLLAVSRSRSFWSASIRNCAGLCFSGNLRFCYCGGSSFGGGMEAAPNRIRDRRGVEEWFCECLSGEQVGGERSLGRYHRRRASSDLVV